jgi:hypothetical protein
MNQQSSDLRAEIDRLQVENEQLNARLQRCLDFDRLIMHLSVAINTKLQLSSTSIKAAVSSLLDRNIFWDMSAQQEFLETIKQSIDHISERMLHMALFNLLEADSLEVNKKFYELHELMRAVQEYLLKAGRNNFQYLDFVPTGNLAYVDYRYFVQTLSILFYAIDAKDSPSLTLELAPAQYVISLSDLSASILTVISSILQEQWASESLYHALPTEKIFELLLVVRLLDYQGIRLALDHSHSKGIRIEIPFSEQD